MKRKILGLTIIFTNSLVINLSAQNKLDSVIALYLAQSSQEKIHLHTDRETYLSGETVWFKAYLLLNDLPVTFSTNLYVDLLTVNGNIIERRTMPLLSGTANSYFTLPDTAENRYILRAYTTWMLNFDTSSLYYKTITIINNSETPKLADEKPKVSLQFFAEGGNMIGGKYNYVAFKASKSNGLPYDFTAVVKNSQGDIIDSIVSVHDGMGLLKFIPEVNENYIADWKDNTGQYRRTPLPISQSRGIILHTEQIKTDLYYLINSTTNTGNFEELTVMATMFQQIVYLAKIKMTQNEIFQKISTKDFSTGVLQLTVFDKSNQPLAERIVFVNNNNYTFKTAIRIIESSTIKRGRNKIEIDVADTLSSNLSIAVYDANLGDQKIGRNIYTDLLLEGDIRGYVYDAAQYFTDTSIQVKEYLDLVMQTNGWRRYNWDKIITGQMPAIFYQKDNYLSVYGKATDNKQQSAAGEMIILIVQANDSSKQWYQPITNKEGLFAQSGLIFYDSVTVFYKLNNSKNKNISVSISKDYNGLSNVNLTNTIPLYLQDTSVQETQNNYNKIFIAEIKNRNPEFEKKAKILSEVIVKSNNGWQNWKNDPILKMDEKYTNIFSGVGASVWAFDVLHDEMATAKLDIYNYMVGKVPGLRIAYKSGEKSFGGLLIFLDEKEIDNQTLQAINLDNIAYIKYYHFTPWRQNFPPSICVYLKKADDKGEEIKKIPSNLAKFKMAGYSPTKEFYSPDYSVQKDVYVNADLRSTLYWQPYILTDVTNRKIPITFYNNDFTKKIKIVLEGMNAEGKLIYIEKIIE